MNKQLSPALVAGALVVAVVVIGLVLFRMSRPAPTPHPDPARFLSRGTAPSAPGTH